MMGNQIVGTKCYGDSNGDTKFIAKKYPFYC